MTSESDRDRSFERLRALTQALAHRFRTPLSVISNDLTFCKSTFKSEEFDRSIRRCKELSEQLSYIASFFAERDDGAKIDLGHEAGCLSGPASARLSANPFRVALATMLDALIEGLPQVEVAQPDRTILSGTRKPSVGNPNQLLVYDGFTSLFFDGLGQDIIDAPLFDTLITDQRISTKISLLAESIKIELWR